MLPYKKSGEIVYLTIFTVLCVAAIRYQVANLVPILLAGGCALALVWFLFRHVPRLKVCNDRGHVVYEYPPDRHKPATWADHNRLWQDYQAYLQVHPDEPQAEIAYHIGTNPVTLAKVIQEHRLGYFAARGALSRLAHALWTGKIRMRDL